MNSLYFHGRGLSRAALFIVLLVLALTLSIGTFTPSKEAAAETGAPVATEATLTYSSYLGGNNDDNAWDIAVDSQGNIYVLGTTYSSNLLGQTVTISGDSDIYVAKFSPNGKTLLYLTLFGGPSDDEYPSAIELDSQGNAYVSVYNLGDGIPLKNPLWANYTESDQNGALFKLDSSGKLVYSTLIRLNMFNSVRNNDESLAVDGAGNAYLTGKKYVDFDTRFQIGMLKINPTGTALLLEKYVGGPGDENGLAIAVDNAGKIVVAGTTEYSDSFPTTANAHQSQCGDVLYGGASSCDLDGVVVGFDATGKVIYSSYHGGDRFDYPLTIDADGKGNLLIAGDTNSAKFPLANALQNSCPTDNFGDCQQFRGFISLINLNTPKATQTYSTYLGSTEKESSSSVRKAVLDSAGQATVAGYTNGQTFPVAQAVQPELSPGICISSGPDRYCDDAFLVTFTPTGGLFFGTYLGGSNDDYAQGLAVSNGQVYVAGLTESTNFPVTADALQPNSLPMTDGYVAKITIGGSQPPPPPPTGPHLFLPSIIR